MSFTSFLPYLNIVLSVCLAFGGLFAFRQGYFRQTSEISKQTGEIQERVIAALTTELDTMRQRIDRVEHENQRLENIISTVQAALLKKGIHVTIDGDLVTIEDTQQKKTYTRSTQRPKKPTPSP